MQISWAHTCAVPAFARKKRVRGSKAAGLTYERKLRSALPRGTLHGQWFIYCVAGSIVAYCQPDFLLLGKSEVAVLEAKLTDVEAAWKQLDELYEPVLTACYARKVLKVAVVKSLSRVGRGVQVCTSLKEALEAARAGERATLHWIGTGELR